MRLLAVFSLATGAMAAFAKASLKVSERPLFRALWDMLDPDDVVLADRGFCGYAEGWLLSQRGVDWVMRNHQRRTVGVSPVRRIGKNDRIVQWLKTKVRPAWMERDQWRAMPDTMAVREVTVHVDIPGFRTRTIVVVTSLLNETEFTAEDFARLYLLRCKTPEMVHRELLMHIIAYNLLRAVMADAATPRDLQCSRLSFKTALSTVRQWETAFAQSHAHSATREALLQHMLQYIARAIIPDRPDRIEPRAIKRRPKEYDRLNKPRSVMRQRLIGQNP
jgi:hypothetical protein